MNAKVKVGISVFWDPGGHLGPGTPFSSPLISKCCLVFLLLGVAGELKLCGLGQGLGILGTELESWHHHRLAACAWMSFFTCLVLTVPHL